MDGDGQSDRSGRDTYMVVILCVLVGLPLFVFLNILTSGLFILIFVSLGGIGILAAFHYFLWGRSFDHQVAGEREEEEARAREEEWPYDEPRTGSY
jgi:hypothetical protein